MAQWAIPSATHMAGLLRIPMEGATQPIRTAISSQNKDNDVL